MTRNHVSTLKIEPVNRADIELVVDMALSGGGKPDVESLFDSGAKAAALAGSDERDVGLRGRVGGAEPGNCAGGCSGYWW